jgi:transposase
VGRGRDAAGPEAGEQESVGPCGTKTRGPLQAGLRVDLPLRLRPSPERGGLLDDPAHGEHRAVLFGARGGVRKFAKEVGAGADKRILLVVDKAGWHTGGEVEIPEGIELEFLPNGSPELMPAERLWPLTNEALANGLFEEIGEIEEALVQRCVELLDQPEAIRDLANYHWWPQTA